MMLNVILTALPLGDDTPIALYATIGGIAAVLLIVSSLMGKKDKKKRRKKRAKK